MRRTIIEALILFFLAGSLSVAEPHKEKHHKRHHQTYNYDGCYCRDVDDCQTEEEHEEDPDGY